MLHIYVVEFGQTETRLLRLVSQATREATCSRFSSKLWHNERLAL